MQKMVRLWRGEPPCFFVSKAGFEPERLKHKAKAPSREREKNQGESNSDKERDSHR
jgi:hypothetical protein